MPYCGGPADSRAVGALLYEVPRLLLSSEGVMLLGAVIILVFVVGLNFLFFWWIGR